jgi:hypothetical protein
MNYLACKHIEQRGRIGKWIAMVGNSQANAFEGVPG